MRRFGSGPLIARLLLVSRMSTNERLRSGAFGPTFRLGRIVYASLEAVEAIAGVQFTAQQIADAVVGKPDRIMILTENKEVV